jgi:hypothetical protein
VRGHPHEPAQDELGEAERLVGGDRRLEPGAEASVIRRSFVEGVDEDVDVEEDQRSALSI